MRKKGIELLSLSSVHRAFDPRAEMPRTIVREARDPAIRMNYYVDPPSPPFKLGFLSGLLISLIIASAVLF